MRYFIMFEGGIDAVKDTLAELGYFRHAVLVPCWRPGVTRGMTVESAENALERFYARYPDAVDAVKARHPTRLIPVEVPHTIPKEGSAHDNPRMKDTPGYVGP